MEKVDVICRDLEESLAEYVSSLPPAQRVLLGLGLMQLGRKMVDSQGSILAAEQSYLIEPQLQEPSFYPSPVGA